MSKRRKFLFSAVAIVIVLGLLELASATVLLMRGSSKVVKKLDLKRRFQPLRYELSPGKDEHIGNGAVVHINRVGLRGPEVDAPKTRIRILCVGDSCTFGYAPDVTDDLTYPALLGQRLDTQRPSVFGVVNGGMPNFCSLDILNYFLYKGTELDPDYIVIMCGWNDSHHVHDLQRSYHVYGMPSEDQSSGASRFVDSFATTRLARRVWWRFVPETASDMHVLQTRDEILTKLSQLPEASDAVSDEALARYTRILRSFVQVARARSTTPILVTLPHFTQDTWTDLDSLNDEELKLMQGYLSLWNLSPQGWHNFITRTNDALRQVAKVENCTLVEGANVDDPKLFADICHLNARGNDRLAALVEKAVLDEQQKTTDQRQQD